MNRGSESQTQQETGGMRSDLEFTGKNRENVLGSDEAIREEKDILLHRDKGKSEFETSEDTGRTYLHPPKTGQSSVTEIPRGIQQEERSDVDVSGRGANRKDFNEDEGLQRQQGHIGTYPDQEDIPFNQSNYEGQSGRQGDSKGGMNNMSVDESSDPRQGDVNIGNSQRHVLVDEDRYEGGDTSRSKDILKAQEEMKHMQGEQRKDSISKQKDLQTRGQGLSQEVLHKGKSYESM